MQKPLEVTFRGVPTTEDIGDLIEEKVAKLEKVCNYITSCSIAIERPQLYQRMGNPFRVRIDIRIPHNHEIVVKRESTEGDMHDSLQMVLRDAFKAARLAVEDLVQKQRREVKPHFAVQSTGIVHRLMKGYGFITTGEGRELYFHENSVVNMRFGGLKVGDSVRFTEEPGENGPQTTTLELIQRPGAPIESGDISRGAAEGS